MLRTPSQNAPFRVSKVDADGVVLLLGKGEWVTRLTWECLEGIPGYVKNRGGVILIGGRHEVEGNPGTLDEYLKGCVKRTTAGWVAVLLETAGILDIIRERPGKVRVIDEPQSSAEDGP